MSLFDSDRVLALDIGASKVVLAEFRAGKTGPLELINYGIDTVIGDHDSETERMAYISGAIQSLMRDHGIAPAPLMMTISGQAVFPRFVKLPPVTRDKVKQIIQYEAEQNVPFPIDEVVWDYQLIGGVDGEMNVMLVAVKIENVKRLTDCVVSADLEPEIVDVAPMALYNTVRFNYPELTECVMVLDIGARSSNLIFIEDNRIFSRSIPVAGNAITQEIVKEFELSFEEAEQLKRDVGFVSFGGVYAGPEDERADRVSKIVRNVLTRLHAEVNRSINFYRSQQGGTPPSTVLLSGGSSIIPYADTFFQEKLKVDVEYLNPFRQVVVGDGVDQDAVGGDMHLLAEAVGLGLRRSLSCPVEINLMPPDLVARKILRGRQPYFVVSAVSLVLIMLCLWGSFNSIGNIVDRRTQLVKEEIESLADLDAELTAAGKQRGLAEGRLKALAVGVESRTVWLKMLEELHTAMHQGMWLTGVKPGVSSGSIPHLDIEVRAFVDRLSDTDEGTATELFRDRLRAVEMFTDKTEIVNESTVGAGDHLKTFTVRLHLVNPIPSPAS